VFVIRVFANSWGNPENKNEKFPELSTIFYKVPEALCRSLAADHATSAPHHSVSTEKKKLRPAKVNQSQYNIKNAQAVNKNASHFSFSL
jgi:hypothetical protein